MTTRLAAGLVAVMIGLTGVNPVRAQSAPPPTPTTRILAIGTLNPGVDPAAARAILPTEVRETVKLYLDGKIDQWFSLQGRPGVVFILNVVPSRGEVEQYQRMKHELDELVGQINGAYGADFAVATDEEWDRIFNVNLRGVRIACQTFAKYMLEKGTKGSIINVASLSAITPLSRVFTYSSSKAAVLNLTLNLAREWAAQGIRVNALSPGFFPAEQNRKVLTPDRVESIMRHTPMKRFGEGRELAGAVLLMASGSAGSFLTGENIVVDGGFSSMTI